MMRILINRISRNVALDGRPHLQTLTLLSQRDIHPRTTFLDSYDQTSHLHSLAQTHMTAFIRPWTIGYPQIGPPDQHICR